MANKDLKIIILFLLDPKKKFYVYMGNQISEKRFSILSVNYNLGQYCFTRRLYQKSDKYFKFKY